MRYVLGFVVSTNNRVLLIRKLRPEWQKGKLNGVGGKLEGNESDVEAMVREFWEETSVRTVPGQWHHFATLVGTDYECLCFVTYSNRLLQMARSVTDEQLEVHHVADLWNEETIHNVPYLVTMAMDDRLKFPVTLNYQEAA